MREQSKSLAYGALSVTLTVVVLYMGSVLPTARLALLCVSGLAVVLMALRFDWRRALLVYAATAVLSLLLLPGKDTALAYTLLPGWYPLAKLRLERLNAPLKRLCAKLLLANALMLPALLLAGDYLAGTGFELWQILFACEFVFLIYDYALTQIILIYMRKISGRI